MDGFVEVVVVIVGGLGRGFLFEIYEKNELLRATIGFSFLLKSST